MPYGSYQHATIRHHSNLRVVKPVVFMESYINIGDTLLFAFEYLESYYKEYAMILAGITNY